MQNPIIRDEMQGEMLGVKGRFSAVTIGGKGYRENTFTAQKFLTAPRPFKGKHAQKDEMIRAEVRFADNCRNGHNTFSITGETFVPGRRDIESGGCIHEFIAAGFPELAPLIQWHLTSSDGPMHYIANTIYHASDRDHRGLRKGEARPARNGRTGLPIWELVAVNSLGVKTSTTPTGLKYQGAETAPLFILETLHDGDTPPATPRLQWQQKMIVGEGKTRDLNAARACGVWPDATDAELMQEPEALKAALMARHPALVADFRATIEKTGFLWAPEAAPDL